MRPWLSASNCFPHLLAIERTARRGLSLARLSYSCYMQDPEPWRWVLQFLSVHMWTLLNLRKWTELTDHHFVCLICWTSTMFKREFLQFIVLNQRVYYSLAVWRLAFYPLRVPFGTQSHNFVNIWRISMNFCHENCLEKIFSLKSKNCDPLLWKTFLTTPTSF